MSLPWREVRIARPARDLEALRRFYVDDVGLDVVGGFEEHDGYCGLFVGPRGAPWHLELVTHRDTLPQPTVEDELVIYLDTDVLAHVTSRMRERGHEEVEHPNGYWRAVGASVYIDPDGYPLVLCGPRQVTTTTP